MAYEIPVLDITLTAAADLSAKQFYAVKVDSNGKAALSGVGENAVGVLQNKPASGAAAQVMTLGISKAVYGDTVTAGNNLSADAAGKLVPTTSTNAAIAIALESGSAGEIHSVLLTTRTSTGANSGFVLSIPIKLANVADGDVLTSFTPGIAGAIKKVAFAVTDPVTTADKLATLSLKIGTTAVTGGAVALTSAKCTPLGAVVAGSAVTANNAFTGSQAISVVAASTTAFVEGEGVLLVTIQ